MMTYAMTSSAPPRTLSTAGIWKGAFAGAALGAVGNVVLFFAARAGGVDMTADFQRTGAVPMPFPPVVIASFVPAVAAALVAMLVNRFTTKVAPVYTGVALAAGLLSMGGPMNLPLASTGLKIVLALMHVVSGIAITAGILRLARTTDTR